MNVPIADFETVYNDLLLTLHYTNPAPPPFLKHLGVTTAALQCLSARNCQPLVDLALVNPDTAKPAPEIQVFTNLSRELRQNLKLMVDLNKPVIEEDGRQRLPSLEVVNRYSKEDDKDTRSDIAGAYLESARRCATKNRDAAMIDTVEHAIDLDRKQVERRLPEVMRAFRPKEKEVLPADTVQTLLDNYLENPPAFAQNKKPSTESTMSTQSTKSMSSMKSISSTDDKSSTPQPAAPLLRRASDGRELDPFGYPVDVDYDVKPWWVPDWDDPVEPEALEEFLKGPLTWDRHPNNPKNVTPPEGCEEEAKKYLKSQYPEGYDKRLITELPDPDEEPEAGPPT